MYNSLWLYIDGASVSLRTHTGMSDSKPQTVEFMIVTADAALADSFVLGLNALKMTNPVQRFKDHDQGLTYLDSFAEAGSGEALPIVILDMRPADGPGHHFLEEVHRRRPYAEPVVFIVTDDGEDAQDATTTLEEKLRYVAGRLPAGNTAEALIARIPDVLCGSWSFVNSGVR